MKPCPCGKQPIIIEKHERVDACCPDITCTLSPAVVRGTAATIVALWNAAV